MKLTKIFNNNSYFLLTWKICGMLLLLVGMSVQSFGQIFIGKNATVSIQEGTELHISDNKNDKLHTAKVYVAENAKIINLAKDSLVEIVYLKNEKQPQKSKETIAQNKPQKPIPPTVEETDTKPENRPGVLSFNSIPKKPLTLLYSGNSAQLALVQNISFSFKLFPLKKSNNNIVYSFLLNDDGKINTSSNELLLIQQTDLERNITRPPPYQVA